MTLSNSSLAYMDCYKLFDRALEAKQGVRIDYGPESTCGYMGLRFNQARKLDRENNAKIHPDGHELHGRSIYDGISIKKREDPSGRWWLILMKLEALADMVEVVELGVDEEMLKRIAPPTEKVQLELLPMPEAKVRRI